MRLCVAPLQGIHLQRWHSEGRRARLQLDRRFAAGSFGFSPRLAAQWVDSKYVDYYYGVTQHEARSWCAAYEGDSTVNVELGMRIDWQPAPRHAVFIDLGAARMGSTIKNGLLVDEDIQYGVGVDYFYRF